MMSAESTCLPDPQQTMEVAVEDVAAWLQLPPGEQPRLIDCREQEEYDYCRIERAEWIPLGVLPDSLEKFDSGVERGVVIYCHHGMRSMHAAAILRNHGVEKVFSMAGGIDAWAQRIDTSVPRY